MPRTHTVQNAELTCDGQHSRLVGDLRQSVPALTEASCMKGG